MGCFGRGRGSETPTDFDQDDWANFDNPVADDYDDRRGQPKLGGSTLTTSVDPAHVRARRKRSHESFEVDGSYQFPLDVNPSVIVKDARRVNIKSAKSKDFDDEEALLTKRERDRLAQCAGGQGSSHSERIKQTQRDRENEDMSGVLPGGNYAERDASVFLDYTDWTTVDNKERLQLECTERGLATHGRMLAFSMIALQVCRIRFPAAAHLHY